MRLLVDRPMIMKNIRFVSDETYFAYPYDGLLRGVSIKFHCMSQQLLKEWMHQYSYKEYLYVCSAKF